MTQTFKLYALARKRLEELLEKPMIQMMMSFEQRQEVLAKVEKKTTMEATVVQDTLVV